MNKLTNRINNRYIEAGNNLYLYYTIASLSKINKARIDIKLAAKDNDGKITKYQSIKTSLTCESGTEEYYAEYVTRNKDEILNDLYRVLKVQDKALFRKLGRKSSDINVPRFREFYMANHEYIARVNCWAKSTRDHYHSTIKNQLAPLLDTKPMCELTADDYYAAVDKLHLKRKEAKKEYGDGRLDQFIGNLGSVAEYAKLVGVCETNPLKEISYKLDPLNKAKDDQLHRKSIDTKETENTAMGIANSYGSDSSAIGTAFQLYMGGRPAEVCGFIFGDIVYFKQQPDRCYLNLNKQYTQKSSSEGSYLKSELKTVNGYRCVPVTRELQALIEDKQKYLTEMGFSDEQIINMPIVNMPVPSRCKRPDAEKESLKKHCDPRQLSDCGKSILFKSAGKRKIIEVPLLDCDRTEDGEFIPTDPSLRPIESDVQAYELRRIFASRMAGICGLTMTELQYIMGHALEYDMYGRANDFVLEDKQLEIMHKMDRAITITDSQAEGKGELITKMSAPDPRKRVEPVAPTLESTAEILIEDETERHFVIIPPSDGSKVTIRIYLQAIEPGDGIRINVKSEGTISGMLTPISVSKISNEPRKTTNVISRYYDDVFGESICDTKDDTTNNEGDLIDGEDLDENEDYDDSIDEQSAIEYYESESERIWQNNFESTSCEEDDEE